MGTGLLLKVILVRGGCISRTTCHVVSDFCPWQDTLYGHVSTPLTVSSLAVYGGLQRRYIQKCQISDLYWQFQAEWSALTELHPHYGAELPSYDTFRRRWNSHWSNMIRMREKSQRKQCQRCFDLQQILHNPKVSWARKMEIAKLLRQHQKDQYQDRLLYWSLRWASTIQAQSCSPQSSQSQQPFASTIQAQSCSPQSIHSKQPLQSGTVLTVIIDDMDHSKFAWPRWEFRKQPHELDGLIRPTVTFTGAYAHGWGTYLYMAGPQVVGGSDYFLEVLCQTLEQVWQSCSPQSWPSHLVLVADNTTKSAKNQYVLRFLSYLVGRKIFKSVTLFQLMVGHTHEDLDQLFAVVYSYLKKKPSWETPDEILQHIKSCCLLPNRLVVWHCLLARLLHCPEKAEAYATEVWRPVLMLNDQEQFLPDM